MVVTCLLLFSSSPVSTDGSCLEDIPLSTLLLDEKCHRAKVLYTVCIHPIWVKHILLYSSTLHSFPIAKQNPALSNMGIIASLATPIGLCTMSVISTPCFLVSSRVDYPVVMLDGVQAAMAVSRISEISSCHPADQHPHSVDWIMLALRITSVCYFLQFSWWYMMCTCLFSSSFPTHSQWCLLMTCSLGLFWWF